MMTTRSHFLLVTFCVACLLISGRSTVTAQTVDQIQMTTGSRLEGKIVAATPTEVTIEVRGTKRPVKVNEVKSITFAGEPPELKNGRARILAGKYAAGLGDLKKLNPGQVQGALIKRDLQFYLALAAAKQTLSVGGDKAAAAQSMMAFVRAAPTSHHFFEAAETLGDLALAQGDSAGAVKFYGAIASKAPWPDYKMRASMLSAEALITKGDFAAAQKSYETVIASQTDTKPARRQKLFARVGRGRCLAETESPQSGLKLIEDVIIENDPADQELFGRAYNAQGYCYLKAGQSKAALMAFLHVDVLFYSEPEIHAEALHHLIELWAVTQNSDRSVAARKLLDQRYGGSLWAQKK